MQPDGVFENAVLVIVIVAMLPVAFVIGYAFCMIVGIWKKMLRRVDKKD